MPQGHCTNSSVTYHMSAVTATVTTGTIMFGHRRKMFETAEFFSVFNGRAYGPTASNEQLLLKLEHSNRVEVTNEHTQRISLSQTAQRCR